MLCEHKPGNMASLSFMEIFALMIAEELHQYHSCTSNCITFAPYLTSFSQLHTFSSCAFKEQDLAARQAVEFADGREERKVGS